MKKKRAAVYIRISTNDQHMDMQQATLPEYCEFRRWDIVETYQDTMSGSKDRRPALDRLMQDAKRGKFDVVVVWRFDRFARSTRFLLESLELFKGLNIDFVSCSESIDTSTDMGKAVFTIIAAIAELERSTIRERVIAGQKAAKRKGVRFGRPEVEFDEDKARKLRSRGCSWRQISAELDVPKDTIIRRIEG